MNPPSRKERFLASIPQASIEAASDTLAQRCKFNFSYFEKQAAGQDFDEWEAAQLVKLLDKLKEYGKQPLLHWQAETQGKASTVLSIYGKFPSRSDFQVPKHVPHQALWARFRLDQSTRLIGFVLPREYDGLCHSSGARFDGNTFYVVFLDAQHRFYKTEAA